MSFVSSLGAWNWLIAAMLLFILEVVAPGVFLMWFGVAALVVGLIAMTFDMSLLAQALIFALAAVTSVLVWR